MFIKSVKMVKKTKNIRQTVDKLTNCSEIRQTAKIFFCAFAQTNQKNYVIFAKKRKNCELGIAILKNSLYNEYNHRNGVMGRSVFFFRRCCAFQQ